MFNNNKVVVFGVSSILGEMLARTFLNEGAFVIGADESKPDLESDHFKFIRFNPKEVQSPETLFKEINDYYSGQLDILINVSLFNSIIDLQKVTYREFSNSFSAQLFNIIDINRRLYPLLQASKSGNSSIINIGSANSRSNSMSTGLECLYSLALIKLTRIQAGSYDGVRCNSISPLRTENRKICQSIINTVVFLCSEDARFITGTDFLIDEGKSAINNVRLKSKDD